MAQKENLLKKGEGAVAGEEFDGRIAAVLKPKAPKKRSHGSAPESKRKSIDTEDNETPKKKRQRKNKRKGDEMQVCGVVNVSEAGAVHATEMEIYNLPGQKHDRPDERNPLRIFFETLYQQMPDSEMVTTWMIEWGLLPADETKKVDEKMLKRNKRKYLDSPKKMVSFRKKSMVSAKKAK